ncbi:MAG: SMP-30/gluconolactonase/LRE family protein, partial [Alphaproteobacteria bacterium]|nr:SMP-30/gluconolactonase/LRE family protein [Alphaproteobacteria bacterium]
ILGEGPLWDWRTGDLFWIDIRRQQIFRHNLKSGQQTGQWTTSERIGCIGLTGTPETLLVAAGLTISLMNLATGDSTVLADLSAGRDRQRFNDGKVDSAGRLWVGTMHNTIREPRGTFYRVSTDMDFQKQFGDFVIPNSVCMSPDDKTLYFADSWQRTIWAFDFDIDAGKISNRRVFCDLTEHTGQPDGSTVDSDGYVWTAMYGMSQVIRFDPSGKVDRVIELPASQLTCVAFGGENLDTLFVTSARQNLTPEQLEAEPLAGALFAFKTDVKGLPEAKFGG